MRLKRLAATRASADGTRPSSIGRQGGGGRSQAFDAWSLLGAPVVEVALEPSHPCLCVRLLPGSRSQGRGRSALDGKGLAGRPRIFLEMGSAFA